MLKTILKKKILPLQKGPDLEVFPGEFYQTFKIEIIPIIYKLFQKMEEEEILHNLFCKAYVTLTPKDFASKENYRQMQISLTNISKSTLVIYQELSLS